MVVLQHLLILLYCVVWTEIRQTQGWTLPHLDLYVWWRCKNKYKEVPPQYKFLAFENKLQRQSGWHFCCADADADEALAAITRFPGAKVRSVSTTFASGYYLRKNTPRMWKIPKLIFENVQNIHVQRLNELSLVRWYF